MVKDLLRCTLLDDAALSTQQRGGSMILQNEKHQFSDIELYNKIKRQEKLEFYLTWPVLILTFIFCLPLGIYLIHQRTTVDKEAALKIYKFINVIGWVIVIFLLINMAIDIAMDIELDQFEGELMEIIYLF